MSTHEQIRRAHRIVDALKDSRILSSPAADLLHSFLPELPKQKTLEEIIGHVYDAWLGTDGNDWGGNEDDPDVAIGDWLKELHEQLKGLKDTSAVFPALPAGMRLAEHEEYGRVGVSPKPNDIGQYKIFHLDDSYVSGADVSYVEADALTFIDAEPAHPEFLKTAEDYRLAPRDTIVAIAGSHPWIKTNNGMWKTTDFDGMTINLNMSICSRRVLRWGMGDVNEQL